MKTLTYVSTKGVDELVWPAISSNTDLYSSALLVFTDFQKTGPRVIESHTQAYDLALLMKKEHVRMKMVVDEANHFVGIISLEDLTEDVFIKHIANGFRRNELLVSDLMRPKESLIALSYSSLKKSDIESLIFSQRNNMFQHLLVMDEDIRSIRGIISSNDVARQLRLDVDIACSNFAQIYEKAITSNNKRSEERQVA
ncbi:CBS domain-containing protein [Marinomonas hwangdonensis]|uniref:CBS domain-containing protein n=1 Tax=Marinomonas hwangdonensis TaxID=1053647 RepID=A0A3M8Q1U6_9GAMM|nr:CBS domain-containing protein [Marinomonas hwangdonensis]RNF49996.1 CBS domain-containing protein [Marinomonas hwangdonensis]